jgi:hypothetical protein
MMPTAPFQDSLVGAKGSMMPANSHHQLTQNCGCSARTMFAAVL